MEIGIKREKDAIRVIEIDGFGSDAIAPASFGINII
jgi:hypothetical protein